jgi:drug/metabolite transporter (DMT)-like permease
MAIKKGIHAMKMKIVAGFAFLLNTFLFATYYSVAKEALERIDPIVFTFLVMITLAPVGLCILVLNRKQISKDGIKSGALLGSCLCLGLFTLAVALKYNSATSTAFFPSLNGLLAAGYAWLFLRQPIHKITWFSGSVSVAGAVLLIANLGMGGLRGSLIAFIGGLFCTLYVFLADHEQRDKAYWPLFGAELLTMAAWACLIALLFGNWQDVHPALSRDIWVVLYISLGTTFLPTLITVLLQKYIKPLTVSFIYILEPVLGALVAYIYLHETMSVYGYIGGGLIVMGTIINTWGTAQLPMGESAVQTANMYPAISDQGFAHTTSGLAGGTTLSQRRPARVGAYLPTSLFATPGYSLLCCCLGALLVYRLGGIPPTAWSVLYHMGMQLPVYMQQEPAVILLLLAQAISWLVAWVVLAVMGVLTAYRVLSRHLARQAPTPAQKSFNPRRVAAYAYPSVNRDRPQPLAQPYRRLRTDFVELMEKS